MGRFLFHALCGELFGAATGTMPGMSFTPPASTSASSGFSEGLRMVHLLEFVGFDVAANPRGPLRRQQLRQTVFTLANMPTGLARLLKGEKTRLCPTALARRPEQQLVHAGIRTAGYGVPGGIQPRCLRPRLHPGTNAGLQLGNDCVGDVLIDVSGHDFLFTLGFAKLMTGPSS